MSTYTDLRILLKVLLAILQRQTVCTLFCPVVAVCPMAISKAPAVVPSSIAADVYSHCVTQQSDDCIAGICARSLRPQDRGFVKASAFQTT